MFFRAYFLKGLEKVLRDFIYTGRNTLTTTIREILNQPLPLFKFTAVMKRITEKINAFVETFEEGIDDEALDEKVGREAQWYQMYVEGTTSQAADSREE